MSKNLRIAIPMIMLLVAGYILYHIKQVGPVKADGGVAVLADAGVALAPEAGVAEAGVLVLDAGLIAASGDAGSPGKIPACGNCSFDPVAGVLRVQAQGKFPFEEPLPWTIIGVEVIYQNDGGITNSLAKADAGSLTLTAADLNCSTQKNFPINPTNASNIQAINVRIHSNITGINFKRGCVKEFAGGGVTILETGCNCCGCALCTDVGYCQ